MKFRVEPLEDRIVFDGAIAHDVAAAPAPAPANAEHSNTEAANNRVLIISDNLHDSALLKQAAKDQKTIVVSYDNSTTLQDLSNKLNVALDGQKAVSIGFITEGSAGQFDLVNGYKVNDGTIQASPANRDMINFWQNVTSNLLPSGTIDILGCNVAAGAQGSQFLHDFGTMIGNNFTVEASTHLIGSTSFGGNWILDASTNAGAAAVDAGALYFANNEQMAWNHYLAPGIDVSPITGLNTTGTGGTDSFSVVLNSAPTDDVTIGISSSDTGEGTVSTSLLTFTPLDWFTPQVVTITGVNDGIAHAVGYTIITDPASSLDLTYNGIDPADVSVTNTSVEPTISITSSVIHNEGNAGTVSYAFTVTLDYISSLPISVNYDTADVTATAGVDYIAASGVLNFAPGDTTQTIIVNVNGDNFFEPNETFSVNLSAPTNATISSGTGIGTINNDDASPAINVTPVSGLTTTGTGGSDSFNVVLSSAPTADVTLGISSSNTGQGTVSTPSLTFDSSNWDIPQVVTVTGVNDGIAHSVAYTVITGAATSVDPNFSGINPADVSVTNTSVQPTLSINSVIHNEGNSGTTPYIFTVTLSTTSSLTVNVNYATANGSANAGSDYIATSGVLSFSPGQLTRNITVLVNGDTTPENNEYFVVNLSSPINSTIDSGVGVGAINNDDLIPGTVNLPATVRDFLMYSNNGGIFPPGYLTNPDFENSGFDNQNLPDTNIVTNILGPDFKPVYAGGSTTTHGSTFFNQWYNDTANYNVSIPISLLLVYNPSTGLYDFNAAGAQYFPIDGQGLGNQNQSHNFSFTTELHTSFTYTGGETFTLSGDDDLFVYINNRLVTNLGGVHAEETSTLNLGFSSDHSSLASQLGMVEGQTYRFDLFHAERHTHASDLQFSTNLQFAGLSINDVIIAEGNSGTSTATFTVTLSSPALDTVSVDYATVDGTATVADGDYAPSSGTLLFAPGEQTKTITVLVNGDTKLEPDQTFVVNLSNPVNAIITDSQAIGTITNDDAGPIITVNNVSIVEGNSGTSLLNFTITRTGLTDFDTTFNFATADGTATLADSDYVAASGTRTILAGGTTGTANVSVTINGDIKFETDETFSLNVSGATNAANSNATGIGTILNDDTAPILSINNVSINEGNSGTSTMTFTVTRTGLSDVPVNFNYATADITATTTDNDYVAAGGTGIIAGGGSSATTTINVTIIGDLKYENNETFSVNLSGVTNATPTSLTGTGTILNDDTPPLLSISDVSAAEGNSGTSILTFTVTRTGLSDLPVNFNYATADGTALIADNDYIGRVGTGSILGGGAVGTTTIAITINGDVKYETDETFTLNVTGATNVQNSAASGTGTILNDDAVPTISFVNNDGGFTGGVASTFEGNTGSFPLMHFKIQLSNPSYQDITFSYSTADITATVADNDYTPITSNTATIAAGTTSIIIDVQVVGDVKYESNEIFNLGAVVTSGTVQGVPTFNGVGTIIDDDLRPVLSINNASVVEGDSGTSSITFTVTRTGETDFSSTFNYATADNTAFNVLDYLATSGTSTIAAGGATATTTITVQVVGDTIGEANKSFFVNLSNPVTATIGTATGIGTIIDNDTPTVTLTSDPFTGSHATATVGGAGTTAPLVFHLQIGNISELPITVHYSTADGTALAGHQNYTPLSGTVVFNPGETAATVTVIANGENVVKDPTNMFLLLDTPANAFIETSPEYIGTIISTYQPSFFVIPQAPNYVPPTHTAYEPMNSGLTQDQYTGMFASSLTNYEPLIDFLPDIIVTGFNSLTDGESHSLVGEFKVFLTAQPKAPVTIDLKGFNIDDKAITPRTITFTPENWNHPQIIDVEEKLTLIDPNVTPKVITQPAKSADPYYDGYKPGDVELVVPLRGEGGTEVAPMEEIALEYYNELTQTI